MSVKNSKRSKGYCGKLCFDRIFFCYKESNRLQVFYERRGTYPGRNFSNKTALYLRNFYGINSIHSRDTFHSRRLPRTWETLIPRLSSLLFPVQLEHLLKLRLIDRKLILHLRISIFQKGNIDLQLYLKFLVERETRGAMLNLSETID